MKKLFFFSILIATIAISSCKKSFLEVPLQGPSVTEEVLANKSGVQSLLVGAYHDLTGMSLSSRWWTTSGTNWLWADITSGDVYRGGYGSAGDEPEGVSIENFQVHPSFTYILNKFKSIYDGVARSNAVLRAVVKAPDMTDNEKSEAIGEARFLRGHYHFQARIMWNKVPYIDENVIDFKVSNEPEIWPQIEADLRFAFDNLDEVKPYKGQANKWAAAAYLAKAYMFQQKYSAARLLLDSVITMGKTAQGVAYDLNDCFQDNFDGSSENSKEAIFQIQFSADKEAYGNNSNLGEAANTPAMWQVSSWFSSWKQPSFNLVNAYKTDANGLPMLDTFNVTNMPNDLGVESWEYFEPYGGTLDPRLDWTVGRRGVPYLDYNYGEPNPGKDWINDHNFGGPFTPIKGVYRFDQQGTYSEYYTNGYLLSSAVNYNLIRFADVLLWAAEAEVEAGTLEKAREYVNRVRTRAMNGCVVEYYGTPAANYFMDLYNDAWADQAFARKAVRFERRLELAAEGHRFFDLVRWGIAAEYINAYLSVEKTRMPRLANVTFTKGKNEYYPLPQIEIDLSMKDGKPLLIQNPGY
jgi:hypothetical protein